MHRNHGRLAVAERCTQLADLRRVNHIVNEAHRCVRIARLGCDIVRMVSVANRRAVWPVNHHIGEIREEGHAARCLGAAALRYWRRAASVATGGARHRWRSLGQLVLRSARGDQLRLLRWRDNNRWFGRGAVSSRKLFVARQILLDRHVMLRGYWRHAGLAVDVAELARADFGETPGPPPSDQGSVSLRRNGRACLGNTPSMT